MMGKIKDFKIGDEKFIARELTVSQVKKLLDEEESGKNELSIIDLLFPDRLPSAAIAMILGISRKELEKKDLPPSELEKIMDEAEAVNPLFASLIQRLAKIGRAMATKSTEPPAG